MLLLDFSLGGVLASSVGIRMQKPITFSAPKPRITSEQVAGRNGDVKQWDGSYENRTAKAVCYALRQDVTQSFEAVNKLGLLMPGYQRLETSTDTDHYWLAVLTNGAEMAERLNLIAPFTLNFDCKPQRFLKSGDFPLVFTAASGLYNPTGYPAAPIITVFGTTGGKLYIGGKTVQLKTFEDGEITIDCETGNATTTRGGANHHISMPDVPRLEAGETAIRWDGGIRRVEIVPRWWTL